MSATGEKVAARRLTTESQEAFSRPRRPFVAVGGEWQPPQQEGLSVSTAANAGPRVWEGPAVTPTVGRFISSPSPSHPE